MRRSVGLLPLVVALAIGVFACGRPSVEPAADGVAGSASSPAERVVRSFLDAFNAHDVEAMLVLASEEIEWLAVDGRAVSVEAAGAEALRAGMTEYFASCPTCRSELAGLIPAGSRVTTLEVARWTSSAGPQSQRGIAVYELDGELIRRVYYFPAEE